MTISTGEGGEMASVQNGSASSPGVKYTIRMHSNASILIKDDKKMLI